MILIDAQFVEKQCGDVPLRREIADQGADYDQINEGGWEKVNELFPGTVNCDSSRVYIATNVRMAEDDDE